MRKFWEFRGAADGGPEAAELLLYGPIGPDDGMGWFMDEVTPKQFREDLTALGDITALKVFINSPGGDVFAGQAIHSMLVRHPARVTVYVDGLCASIASIVAMAGDDVIMPRNAMMMVHNPWTWGVGDAREFRKLADTMDTVRESMIAAYERKTGLDRGRLLSLLNAETWMTAEEAVALGFADAVEPSKQVAASMVRPGVASINGREFDLGRYQNVPDFSKLVRVPGAGEAAPAPTKRDLERALRDAGLSQAAAKAVLARGYESADVGPRDAAPAASADREAEGLGLFLEFQKTLAAVGVLVEKESCGGV